MRRAKDLAHRHADCYFLRLDVKAHFDSIDHDVLLRLVEARIADEGIRWLCRTLLQCAAIPGVPVNERRGLPIGNLTSQSWANVVLDPLDHYLRDSCGAGSFTRYMDDMLVVEAVGSPTRTKRLLCEVAAEAGRFLEHRLRLRLKPSATIVAPVRDGIPWLGLRVFPATVRLTGPARRRMSRKLRASMHRAASSAVDEATEAAHAAGVVGYATLADTL